MEEKEYPLTALEALKESRNTGGNPFVCGNMQSWLRFSLIDGIQSSPDKGKTWVANNYALAIVLWDGQARMVDRSEWFDYEPEPEYELPESLSIESLYAMQDGKRSLGQEYHELARRILVQAREDAKRLIEESK